MIDMNTIDLVIERTGADYETVRQALITADGDVDLAIRIIKNFTAYGAEESTTFESEIETNEGTNQGEKHESQAKAFASDILDAIKEIWERGNASSIIVRKGPDVLINLPLTIGTIGIIMAAVPSIIGLGVAIVADYEVLIKLDNGSIINVNEMAIKRKTDLTPNNPDSNFEQSKED